jgi:hypothetical protein
MLQKVKNLRKVYVRESSHWVQNDRPDVVNDSIQSFLKEEGVEAGLLEPTIALASTPQRPSKKHADEHAPLIVPMALEPLGVTSVRARRKGKNVPSPPHAASVLVQ